MLASGVSGISWLEVGAVTRNRTYLEEALWSLGLSPDGDATLLEQARLLTQKPIPVIREYVSDKTLLLALAEMEKIEIFDIEECAHTRTFSSRILYDMFGYEVTKMRKVVLSACANLLVGERQTIAYIIDFFRSIA